MAEMTAEQALSTLVSLHRVGPYDLSGVIEVIEQQAQEITRLNACLQYEQHRTGRQGTHAEGCYKWGPGHWDCAMREIAKKDRMIDKAIDTLFILPGRDECPDAVFCPITLPNTPDIGVCRKCWRKWLEKEAEVQG